MARIDNGVSAPNRFGNSVCQFFTEIRNRRDCADGITDASNQRQFIHFCADRGIRFLQGGG
jgi:hypothetical protein